jgi:penicillin-binding protein 1C
LVFALAPALAALVLAAATRLALRPVDDAWRAAVRETASQRVTDRGGRPLAVTYQVRWNVTDRTALHDVPPLLAQAFVLSEDRRFFTHDGVDWRARGAALWQNARAGGAVRGASTITEQVVRMLHPRPRTLWSKWVEGFEARALERRLSKAQILEFYLNQVPYAAHRRGVVQGARYYFDRGLDTLSPRELLALAVLVRAPGGYDLYRDPARIDGSIARLAAALAAAGALDDAALGQVAGQTFELRRPALAVDAAHFIGHLRGQPFAGAGGELRSTLDAGLQARVQRILDDRVQGLRDRNLNNAAALVADHHTGEILAWVVAGSGDDATPGGRIDAVTVARQPGSALKPFLYAAALDRGWTAATLIDDAPYAGAVGTGLHRFRNYSNTFYGPVTLREALGNSLNIPAVKTARHVGVGRYLELLRRVGFESLAREAWIYDDGLALGNGEVTLLELVRGYAALANGGVTRPLRVWMDDPAPRAAERVYSDAAATLIGHILADPHARRLEFGAHSVLNFPVQTAVKTGTSTDYRDAWAVGYDDRYVAGIWMGNLDYRPTDGVTGGTGPALALRSVFHELNRGRVSRPLRLSPHLVRRDVCVAEPGRTGPCTLRTELFLPGTEDQPVVASVSAPEPRRFEILEPTDGLQMAIDPRVPAQAQQIRFRLAGLGDGQAVEWRVNGEPFGPAAASATRLWTLERGRHRLTARVLEHDREIFASPEISYLVK